MYIKLPLNVSVFYEFTGIMNNRFLTNQSVPSNLFILLNNCNYIMFQSYKCKGAMHYQALPVFLNKYYTVFYYF